MTALFIPQCQILWFRPLGIYAFLAREAEKPNLILEPKFLGPVPLELGLENFGTV